MYRSFDETNGMPPRIYRSPEQIRNDILEIRSRISEIKENLNIRELISDISRVLRVLMRRPQNMASQLRAD